jgi:hypothetical protein
MLFEEIQSRIQIALADLIADDLYLLRSGLGERCIAHRLAVHLEAAFDEYDVDCEYNRNGAQLKKLPLSEECRELLRRTNRVVPDIVVHKRGGQGPNLLAVEVKIDGQPGEDCDLAKLQGYVAVLGYSYGFYICFRHGDYSDRTSHIVKKLLVSKIKGHSPSLLAFKCIPF